MGAEKINVTKVLELIKTGHATMLANQTETQRVLAEQGKMLVEQVKLLSTVTQKTDDTFDRLFGHDGAIPRVTESINNLEKRVKQDVEEESRVCAADRKELNIRMGKAENRAAWLSGIGTGVGVVAGAAGRWILTKIHF